MKSVYFRFWTPVGASLLLSFGCTGQSLHPTHSMEQNQPQAVEAFPEGREVATFAGGCFWCTEAIYEEVEGVEKVVSGYSGGKVENPTYEAVCAGTTGHAECVQITYNPKVVSYETLLDIHMNTHDPTTLNRQGNDVGTQYRSAIFYHNDSQRAAAETYVAKANEANTFGKQVVTEVVPHVRFYEAENYHQDYFANNAGAPYCVYVVRKKVAHFEQLYPALMKEGYRIK